MSERIVRSVEAPTDCNTVKVEDGERSKGPTVTKAVGKLSRIKIENEPLDMKIG